MMQNHFITAIGPSPGPSYVKTGLIAITNFTGPSFPPISTNLPKPFPLHSEIPLSYQTTSPPSPPPTNATTMSTTQKSLNDTTDDLDNLSVSSNTTSVVDVKHSTSLCSETTWATSSILSSSSTKAHKPASDPCRDAIRRFQTENPSNSQLRLEDFRFVRRLGSGDIGKVFLVELKGSNGCMFAAKVMDKNELSSRNKETRAKIEKEILQLLDHPFLPTLYATLESTRWSCLLTEFCPGGDLHVLQQRKPNKRFDESTVRFYASEVVVAIEYLHMMAIIYRDLKPENVLIRSDGHIMLTDFDLSLKGNSTSSTAQIVSDHGHSKTSPSHADHRSTDQLPFATSSCILPNCIITVSCFHAKRERKKKKSTQRATALDIVAEPNDIRSMSFVGTHEYLAPEIVSGEGHGNAVDWWTLGIFIYEMFYGTTPFKGVDHELTLANIVARALVFPKEPSVPSQAKDLITQLLIKGPTTRMGSSMGATSIKHHPFFDGVNWALLRCTSPPYVPDQLDHHEYKDLVRDGNDLIEYF